LVPSGCETGISSNKGDRVVGSIVLRFRSALTSLVYFSDLAALVSVTIADIFLILRSVKVVASCVVPFVLFKINPFGNDDNYISDQVWRSYIPIKALTRCPTSDSSSNS
jgi:hypothetical protein